MGDFFDVAAEVEEDGDASLGIHDSAGTEGVADALIHSVGEGDVDVVFECLESTDSDEAEDVFGTFERTFSVEVTLDLGGQSAGFNVSLNQLVDHAEVVFVDVVEGDGYISEFGNAENVTEHRTGEPDGAGSEDGNFEIHFCNIAQSLENRLTRFTGSCLFLFSGGFGGFVIKMKHFGQKINVLEQK